MPNLIYGMTEMILKSKLRPVVYTNYEYVSSNKCYQKVGLILLFILTKNFKNSLAKKGNRQKIVNIYYRGINLRVFIK